MSLFSTNTAISETKGKGERRKGEGTVTAQIFTWIDASAYRSYFNVLYFRLCILER